MPTFINALNAAISSVARTTKLHSKRNRAQRKLYPLWLFAGMLWKGFATFNGNPGILKN
jgi:hypothetical protein